MNWIFAILSLFFISFKFETIRDKNWFCTYRKLSQNFRESLELIDTKSNYAWFILINDFIYLLYLFIVFCVYSKLFLIIISLLILGIIEKQISKSKMNDSKFYFYALCNYLIEFSLLSLLMLKFIIK